MATSGKYIDLWAKQTASIKDRLENAITKQSIQLNREDFRDVGDRKKYSFNLELENGEVVNNIGGSAVARDLVKVLKRSNAINDILKVGHFKINMDKHFCLWIQKKISGNLHR